MVQKREGNDSRQIKALLWIAALAIFALLILSLAVLAVSKVFGQDTTFVEQVKLTELCFLNENKDIKDMECYLLDSKGLKKYAKANDLTPKPSPTPYIYTKPTPQE
jgi:hypothetical protein